MIIEGLEALAVPVDDLSLLPGNPRRGDVDAVAKSLATFGQRKPIVAKLDGTVIAGNHTLQAARQLGWKSIAVVRVDDDETTAKAFALADNRTAELGGYDEQALADLIREVGDVDAEMLAATGWGDDAVAALLASLEPEQLPAQIQGDPDDVPDSAPAKTVPGDVWLLGPHRLLCGDAFVVSAVDVAVDGAATYHLISDPPYGMGHSTSYYGSKDHPSRFAAGGELEWDKAPFDVGALLALHERGGRVALWGANYYHANGLPAGTWWVWDKRTSEAADALQGVPYEILWIRGTCAHRIIRHNWAGITARERTGPDKGVRYHPTQKPIAVLAEVLDYLTTPGDVVLDPFAGSGSTLIAAHQTGRTAYLMELDPGYCDVICKRWQKATGILPIAESTGNAHDFCEDDA